MAKKYYAVKTGQTRGIFLTWEECKAQVDGFPGAEYKSFPTIKEAEAYLEGKPAAPKKQKEKAEIVLPSLPGGAVAYVDGSFRKDTGEFSCGAVLFYEGEKKFFAKKYSDPEMAGMHNVAGEIMGAVVVMHYCVENGIPALEIHHDYEGVAKWATGEWRANKPGTRAYVEECHQAREKLKLTFVKVKGHSGDVFNDAADLLARKALGID